MSTIYFLAASRRAGAEDAFISIPAKETFFLEIWFALYNP
jgi:hypothetical protein